MSSTPSLRGFPNVAFKWIQEPRTVTIPLGILLKVRTSRGGVGCTGVIVFHAFSHSWAFEGLSVNAYISA